MVLHGDDAMRRATAARRIGVVCGLLICALLTLAAASALAVARHEPPVTAVDARTGRKLPPDPLLRPGSRVVLTVPGFAPRTKVVVALVGVRHLGTVRASRRGVVVHPYTVPGSLRAGRHRLIFSGPAPPAPDPSGRPPLRRAAAPFVVIVPYDPSWPFRTGQPHTGGAHNHRPGPHGTAGGAVGPPAQTGIDLLPLLVIGAVAIVAGGAALAAGRRRTGPDNSGRNLAE